MGRHVSGTDLCAVAVDGDALHLRVAGGARLTACGSRLQAEPGLSIPGAHETCMRAHGAEPT